MDCRRAERRADQSQPADLAREALGWTAEPFVIPNETLSIWRGVGERLRPRPIELVEL